MRLVECQHFLKDNRPTSADESSPSYSKNFTLVEMGLATPLAATGCSRMENTDMTWPGGHGGQQVILCDDTDMVIIALADPLDGQHRSGPYQIEKGSFIFWIYQTFKSSPIHHQQCQVIELRFVAHKLLYLPDDFFHIRVILQKTSQ